MIDALPETDGASNALASALDYAQGESTRARYVVIYVLRDEESDEDETIAESNEADEEEDEEDESDD